MENILSNNQDNSSVSEQNLENSKVEEVVSLPYIIDGQALVGNIIDIKYVGKLVNNNNNNNNNLESNSEENSSSLEETKIFMQYGYGFLWENPNVVEMTKGENNTYYTSITLEDFDSILFCFKDNKSNWDASLNGSYNLDILKEATKITKVENELPFIPEELGMFDKILENIKKFLWGFFKKLAKAR